MVHRSDEQQHYFNTPFQLSIVPPEAEGTVLSDRWVESEPTKMTREANGCVLILYLVRKWIGTQPPMHMLHLVSIFPLLIVLLYFSSFCSFLLLFYSCFFTSQLSHTLKGHKFQVA